MHAKLHSTGDWIRNATDLQAAYCVQGEATRRVRFAKVSQIWVKGLGLFCGEPLRPGTAFLVRFWSGDRFLTDVLLARVALATRHRVAGWYITAEFDPELGEAAQDALL